MDLCMSPVIAEAYLEPYNLWGTAQYYRVQHVALLTSLLINLKSFTDQRQSLREVRSGVRVLVLNSDYCD